MHILEKIKQHKLQEVQNRKEISPIKRLETSIYYNSQPVSMKQYITDPTRSGIIAEFKRKSPSKGFINKYANPEQVSLGYMQAGASALSVLTDSEFFGGSEKDLETARKFNYCPILRKDFVVDEYQIFEAKSIGADAILLIARILTPEQVKEYTKIAHDLGMEVLLELHEEQEFEKHLIPEVDMVGINNRNLDTFEVDILNSIRLADLLPKDMVKIAESGISNVHNLITLKKAGFQGFLIGEYFMRSSDPGARCENYIQKINAELS